MKEIEYPIKDKHFKHNDTSYDCSHAIERDIPLIINEAETSHKESFSEFYDKQSLKASKVRVFLDEKDNPIFGIVIYTIYNKKSNYNRLACGGYYKFWRNILLPHLYQESICW